MATQHERKFRRFKLKYHVRVSFQSGYASDTVEAVTRNISVGGLLLESARLIPYLCPVEFTITVQGGTVARPITLAGTGEVVRVEARELADIFGIAVACRQPITQLADYFAQGP